MLPFALSQSLCPMCPSKPIERARLPAAAIASYQTFIRRSSASEESAREIRMAQGSSMRDMARLSVDDPGDQPQELRLHQILVDPVQRVIAPRAGGAVQLGHAVARAQAHGLVVVPGGERQRWER